MIPLRVLLIEDSELDAELILRQLKEAGYATTSARVETESQLSDAIQNQWDLIIADYRLPEFDAKDALAVIQNSGIDTPFVIVSGAIGEETAVALMKAGARDYVMKDKLSRLPPVVKRELSEANVRKLQQKAHKALLDSERNLKNSQKVAHVGHWILNPVTGEESWSDEMYRILGSEPGSVQENLAEVWKAAIHPDDRDKYIAAIDLKISKNLTDALEYRIVRPDGAVRFILDQAGEPQKDVNGHEIHYTGVIHDITERKLIELDLFEKMKESQARAHELEVITSISSRLRQVNNRKELVIFLLQELVAQFDADHASIVFVDREYLSAEIMMIEGKLVYNPIKEIWDPALIKTIQSKALGFLETIPPEVMDEIPGWVYENFTKPASLIAYPIIIQTQLIGFIHLDFIKSTVFNQEKRNFIETVAEMAGNALDRMTATNDLEAMVEIRERELESIYKVTSSASATLDINQALQHALVLTLEAVHTSCGAIFLIDESKSDLEEIASLKDVTISEGLFSDPEVRKNLNRVVEQRKALILPDLSVSGVKKKQKDSKEAYSFIGLPMRSQDRVVGVLAIIHEKSEQVLLEELTLLSFIADHLALVVENTRLYKKAEHLAVMEERSRLSRELHDSVTQSLYSASLYSAGAKRYFSTGKYAEVDTYLSQIGELTQQALKDMRLLVYELRSPELKRNGLIGAIQNRLDAVERRANIETEIRLDEIDVLPELFEENLYRIAIETLNNSLKYSQATKLSLSLTKENGEIVFSIQDNGVGFLIENALKSGGVGLNTMRERAERLGAAYNIITLPGKGTKIEVRFSVN